MMNISRYPIGNKEMVVTKDDKGKVVSVTDENNIPAKQRGMGKVKLTDEDAKFRSPIIEVPDDTFILTRHNPTCGWYFWNRRWYYICS